MCGRYTLTSQRALAETFLAAIDERGEGLPPGPWWGPRYNLAPTQPAPVVVQQDGRRVLTLKRWGLLPAWSARAARAQPGQPARAGGKSCARPPLLINARVEGVVDKPMFHRLLRGRRCLVPADGFFEWSGQGGQRRPMWFVPPAPPIAFAGLWDAARQDDGTWLPSFLILTGPAARLVAPIHDRMPLVVPVAAYEAWLDAALSDQAALALLSERELAGWRAHPVSTWVNDARHDDPRCVEVVAPSATP